MNTPIVFVHRGSDGDFNYLNYAALQARLFNPRTTIYVIGDEAARQSLVVPGLELVPLEDYLDSGIPLRSVYQHYRANNPEYTLFCMERWFYLRAFMKREGLERVLHLDGDVMVYANVEEEMGERFSTCDLTLTRGSSTYTTSIKLNAVASLCDLMLSTYHDSAKVGLIRDRWTRARESGEEWEGAGDMHFMEQLADAGGLTVREAYFNHDPVFDSNIGKSGGYEMRGEIKRIEFKNGVPYAFRQEDGEPRRFATLHFQFAAKSLMPKFLHAPPCAGVPGEFLTHVLREAGVRLSESCGRMAAAEAGRQEEARQRSSSAEKMSRQITELKQRRKESERTVREVMRHVESADRSRWLKLGGLLRATKAEPRAGYRSFTLGTSSGTSAGRGTDSLIDRQADGM